MHNKFESGKMYIHIYLYQQHKTQFSWFYVLFSYSEPFSIADLPGPFLTGSGLFWPDQGSQPGSRRFDLIRIFWQDLHGYIGAFITGFGPFWLDPDFSDKTRITGLGPIWRILIVKTLVYKNWPELDSDQFNRIRTFLTGSRPFLSSSGSMVPGPTILLTFEICSFFNNKYKNWHKILVHFFVRLVQTTWVNLLKLYWSLLSARSAVIYVQWRFKYLVPDKWDLTC